MKLAITSYEPEDIVNIANYYLAENSKDKLYNEIIKVLLNDYKEHHKLYESECEVCGKKFIAKRSDGGMYCSNTCTNRAWAERVKADPVKREERLRKCRESARRRRAEKKNEKIL